MKQFMFLLLTAFMACNLMAQAKVVNPGEGKGQLVFLSANDILEKSEKYRSLSPLSIPVFAEMPFYMSVVAGAITLVEQDFLSHVKLKARSGKFPNLDISALPNGMKNELFAGFTDGDFIHLTLTRDGGIAILPSTEEEAVAFYKNKKAQMTEITLEADLDTVQMFQMENMTWEHFDRVGSKAANYAELAIALNTPERTVVRPSMAVPFYYYHQFVEANPALKTAIEKLLRDPLMRKISASSYRDQKLLLIREMILSEETVIDEGFLSALMKELDGFVDASGVKMKMKLRSSTNAEDLPNFNGAGLYTSKSYKPVKKGEEKSLEKKMKSLEEAVRVVWSSVWTLRAYEERDAYWIPHEQVYMGIQINPSYSDEEVDGVLVTKNIAERADLPGAGVYIEAQRGDKHSVANPLPGVRAEKILVLYDENNPEDTSAYRIHTLSRSNVADDLEAVLMEENPVPVMYDHEIIDLVFQSLKATKHFSPVFTKAGDKPLILDMEFKVDDVDTGTRQVFMKQARPFIE